MKYNRIKNIVINFSICIALIITLGISAFAETPSAITFGKDFTFEPGTNNIFSNFKTLMPGESRTQDIKISNESSGSVNFYLKIAQTQQDKNLTKEQQDLFWDLIYNKILINVKDEQGNIIYDGSIGGDKNKISTSDDITDESYYLGELTANTNMMLTVKLTMDSSVNNKYKGLSGSVKWIFIAEQNGNTEVIEIDDNDTPLNNLPNFDKNQDTGTKIENEKTPKGNIGFINTGDPNNIILWITILGTVICAFVAVCIKKKRSK